MSFSVTKNGITVTGDKINEVFRELSDLQEIFSINQCGKCNNQDLRYVVRTVDDNDFYELHCSNPKCRARFAFGQNKGKGGGIFPKRKDKDGNWLPNGGWTKWDKEQQKEV